MYYGESLKVECPTGSGEWMHLGHVAEELQHRLQHLFAKDDDGRRAINAGIEKLDFDPHWNNYLWFHEFFDGDDGRGLGATHQTGWTGLIAKMIHDSGINCRLPHTPRTPSVAANHYFDEIFSKAARPKPYMGRRMSTRSIANRSDFTAETPGAEDEDEEQEQERQRAVDDSYVLDYVTSQLQRVRSHSITFDPNNDEENEFEATANGWRNGN